MGAGGAGEESQEVLLRFRYEEQDFVHAMRLRVGRELRGRVDYLLAGVVIVLGVFLAYKFAPPWMWHLSLFLFFLTVLAVVVVILASTLVMPRVLFRRDPKNQTELTFEFSDAGVSVRAGDRYAKMKWRTFARCDEDANTYVLYSPETGLTVIPRRVFRNERQEKAFRHLIGQFVPREGAESEEEDDA
jgi:hypothetical protein